MDSILETVKSSLGVELDYADFDTDILLGINTSLMTLSQMGIGPAEGLTVTSIEDVWSDFLTNAVNLEAAKNYVTINTRLIFDPPATSFVLEAMKSQRDEILWRLGVQVDSITEEA